MSTVSAETTVEPSLLHFLDPAAAPWRRLPDFPRYSEAEQQAGDDLVAEMASVLADVDPVELDRVGALPDGLIGRLRAAGFLALRNEAAHGGRQASDYNAFRVIEQASRCSVAIGQFLAVQNGIGAPARLPGLPDGPLRDLVARYVRAGAVSGCSDTEPAGSNNRGRDTTARATEDGAAYLLDGEKRFATTAPVADLMVVTAIVHLGDGRREFGLVFVDTTSPGVTVSARQEYLGSRGLPNGSLRFDAVRVPAAQVVVLDAPDGVGTPPNVGRLLINAAPALAIVRECLRIGREFVAGRRIDGRPLAGYDQIQRFFGTTLAEAYAVDSVIRWSLLGAHDFEQALAKNIGSVAAWRVADRTVSVLGGAGLETATSKLRRGAAAMPVEQLLRDARSLRVAGNVDFMVDIQAGRTLLARPSGPCREWPGPVDADLSAANREHLDVLVADMRRLSRVCADRGPGCGEETERVVGRIAGVLLAMVAVLARVEQIDRDELSAELADVYCTDARRDLTGLWHELSAPPRDFSRFARIG